MSAQGKVEKALAAKAKALAPTPARERLALLFDVNTFVEIGGFATADGTPAGVVCGYGAVAGSPVYAFAQDSTENGGAVGKAHAAKIEKMYDWALKTGAPVIGIYDSQGARVAEGAGALEAYGAMILKANNLSGVVPQISLVLGTCVGTSAMMACGADFLIMSEKAEFLAAPSVAGGSSAAAAKSGVAHIVEADDKSAIETARKLVAMMPLNNLSAPPVFDYQDTAGYEEALRAACESGAAGKKDIVAAICDADSVVEMFPSFGKKVFAAMTTIGGFTVGVIATGGDNLCANCCAKIARLVSVWDAFQIPVLTLVNTAGIDGDTDGDGLCFAVRDMAKLTHVYAEATTAKIAVITGKAYGAAYVALASKGASADYTLAWPSAIISPLSPEAAVAFSYGDRITAETPRAQVVADYIENEASAYTAAAAGHIDDVIDPAMTRPALLAALDLLSAKRVHKNPKKHGNIPF